MSTPIGMYGGLGYQSSEVRALGGITPESYDYRDQAKTMSKLVYDVSYMAGMQRKMQEGIDSANQNVFQQLQGLIDEIIVIFGGGGDTGFDFGDLKYIFQAIGALFGLEPGGTLPFNLFDAAWHFFSQYLFPFGNFRDAMDTVIDAFISTILDVFGEVPIVGEALQQFAAFVSDSRDFIEQLFDQIDAIVENISHAFQGIPVVGPFIGGIFDSITGLFGLGSTAQGGADNANKAVASLEARISGLGGVINEDFAGTGTPTGYTFVNSGPNTSVYPKLDGNGNLGVNLSGTTWRKCIGVLDTPTLGSDNGIVKFVVKKKAAEPAFFSSPSWKYALARVNASGTEYVYVKWCYNAMNMGFAVGGVEYDMGSNISFTENDGQLIELHFGVGGTPRRMKAFVNGSEKIDRTDATGNMVTTNRHGGWIFHVNNHPFGMNEVGSFAIMTGLDV
jgi:hypothetical protein